MNSGCGVLQYVLRPSVLLPFENLKIHSCGQNGRPAGLCSEPSVALFTTTTLSGLRWRKKLQGVADSFEEIVWAVADSQQKAVQ
jgi:hypothetical protein